MKGHSFPSPPSRRLSGICAVFLCIPLALAQKESAIERRNRLADAALAQIPEKVKDRKNPFDGDAEAVAAGGKLFEQHCANCHGKKAAGTKTGASLLREGVRQATPGTLFWILTNGVVRHGMPAWSKLPEPQRWQIVTFLGSLKSNPMTPSTGTTSQKQNKAQ
jgi:mono/diheme cytochrome c family protein